VPEKYLKEKSDLQEKLFMSIRAPLCSNQSMLGAIFSQIYREFYQVLRDFVRILWGFARIFTKSKLLGVRLHPLHPASYTSAALDLSLS